MPNFIYAFEGGRMPASQEEGEASMQAWGRWMGELGPAIVDGGGPVGKSKTVSAAGVVDGGGVEPLMGYCIVKAETIEAALDMLKGCPHFDYDGTVEVAEVLEM